jgi:hypothetical protein
VEQDEVKKLADNRHRNRSICGNFHFRGSAMALIAWWNLVKDWLAAIQSSAIPIGVAFAIVGAWLYFAFALSLPTPIRAAMLWGLFITLVIVAPERK